MPAISNLTTFSLLPILPSKRYINHYGVDNYGTAVHTTDLSHIIFNVDPTKVDANTTYLTLDEKHNQADGTHCEKLYNKIKNRIVDDHGELLSGDSTDVTLKKQIDIVKKLQNSIIEYLPEWELNAAETEVVAVFTHPSVEKRYIGVDNPVDLFKSQSNDQSSGEPCSNEWKTKLDGWLEVHEDGRTTNRPHTVAWYSRQRSLSKSATSRKPKSSQIAKDDQSTAITTIEE